MKVNGTATLNAPMAKVFEALNDPAVLVRTIPGCHTLDEVAESSYRMTVTAGVASIKGTYQGDVQLTDLNAPESFVLRASGSGAPGTLSADVRVRLADLGGSRTQLEYDADATVGGMIGGVGQRVLTGVAKKTAGEFFSNVDDVLTGKRPLVEATAPTASADPESPATRTYGAPSPAPAGVSDDYVKGVLVGAAIALAGAALGGLLARRGR